MTKKKCINCMNLIRLKGSRAKSMCTLSKKPMGYNEALINSCEKWKNDFLNREDVDIANKTGT